jgi:ABC-type transporter Mla maintaining outer membrane lipid asymmetry ATPase subunit MlaF
VFSAGLWSVSHFLLEAYFPLSDIDLVILRGPTAAFIGTSGSGKTTLVDLVLEWFPEFDGEIAVDGKGVHGCLPA